MKILHVSHNFYPVMGGMERNIEDICRGLIELGHRSDVCCLRVPGTAGRETYNGIDIHRVRAASFRFYKIAPQVMRLARKYNIVHVHGLGFFSDMLGLAKMAGLLRPGLVLSTHGGIFHTRSMWPVKKAYFHIWSRLPLRGFDMVVAVSKSDMQLFSCIAKRMTLIPDTIDFQRFSRIKRRPENGVFIFVGRLSRNKRIDNLIRAFALVAKSRPGFMLFIIGDDWDGQKMRLKQMASKEGIEGRVVFTGSVDDENLMRYYQRAQFFMSASEYEGFGISVLEAMAAGVPVMVNNIPAFRTFVDNGKNGFIINFNDAMSAARSIERITDSADLASISRSARTTAKTYDYRQAARRLERLYRDSITS